MLLPANFKTTTALENLSVRYVNDKTKFAALQVLPAFLVPQSHFKYYVYDKQNLRSELNLDAPSGTESPRFDYQVRTASGLCKEFAAKHLVLEKDARDFDRPVADLRQDAALANMDKMLIKMEVDLATACAAGNFATANKTTLTNKWSTSNGDPIEEVRVAREAVWASCARRPNSVCMDQHSLDLLKNHPSIVDRIKFVGLGASAGSADAVVGAIGRLFELDIIVSDVAKLTSNEGATDVLAGIWGSTALVFLKDISQNLRQQSFGRTFIANEFTVKSLDKPELARGKLGAEEVESSVEYVMQGTMLDSNGKFDAGYLISNCY